MPTDDVTRAGQILSARTLAYPGEQEAWKLTLDRILKERIPPTFAEDQRRAADEWVEFTGSPMPTKPACRRASSSRVGRSRLPAP